MSTTPPTSVVLPRERIHSSVHRAGSDMRTSALLITPLFVFDSFRSRGRVPVRVRWKVDRGRVGREGGGDGKRGKLAAAAVSEPPSRPRGAHQRAHPRSQQPPPGRVLAAPPNAKMVVRGRLKKLGNLLIGGIIDLKGRPDTPAQSNAQ
ncbi:hypothetical protein LSTR_LSTR004825 [Laodelphax striatellus]|uniref:Uncharacterized protein n=1 Tax=Laodelphax striatellus TaxID=195883 RepID=A0A482WHW7_LAOST|nr:hypothetical protein LSTR_LSTR004825 [Laodelphax striatellus]